MEIFSNQINEAAKKGNLNILIMVDANLDSNKWDEMLFAHPKVASTLRNAPDKNELV